MLLQAGSVRQQPRVLLGQSLHASRWAGRQGLLHNLAGIGSAGAMGGAACSAAKRAVPGCQAGQELGPGPLPRQSAPAPSRPIETRQGNPIQSKPCSAHSPVKESKITAPPTVHLLCSSSISSMRFCRTRRADSRLAMRLQIGKRESVCVWVGGGVKRQWRALVRQHRVWRMVAAVHGVVAVFFLGGGAPSRRGSNLQVSLVVLLPILPHLLCTVLGRSIEQPRCPDYTLARAARLDPASC